MTVFAQEVMTPIKLSGSLATRFGRNHQRVISHKKEAFRALSVTIPGFEEYLITSKMRGLTFAIFVGGKNVGKEELELASGGQEIRIVPVIIGSKKAGVFQTILGAVLVVVGAVVGVMTSWTGVGGAVGLGMMKVGGALMLGGVVQMLSPQVGG
ncbi:TPA: tail assembly protein, partial [Yersinia enterocolitica]